jgi:ABC-type transport system involved in multi-copper enzyme maturation permease subunit
VSTLAPALAARNLVSADVLKLRRRGGLVAVVALLTLGVIVVSNTIIEPLHLSDSAKHGPAGGVAMLGHQGFVISALGAVAAAIVGSTAGSGDLAAGVYRDLVVTGRSRLALYASRVPGGLLFLVPLVAAAYALEAGVSVVFAGGHPHPSTYLLTVTGLWVVLKVVFYYLLAIGIACVVGSRSYAIGILLAWTLAVTPLLASISALGVVRELVPGVAIDALLPGGLGDAARQGPVIGMSITAVATVLIAWTVAALTAGAARDTTRDT